LSLAAAKSACPKLAQSLLAAARGQRRETTFGVLSFDATPFSPLFLRRRKPAIIFQENITKGASTMAKYVSLIQFTDQGIRNVKDTVKRGEATMAEAEKMGMKIIEELWTMGAYDVVALFEAPDDETMTAFACKVSSLGNVKTQTMRAFRKEEMEGILAKIK
jgi:uncharacterized protein with GYD domain